MEINFFKLSNVASVKHPVLYESLIDFVTCINISLSPAISECKPVSMENNLRIQVIPFVYRKGSSCFYSLKL